MIIKLFLFDYNVRIIVVTIFAAKQSHATRTLGSATNNFHPSGNNVKITWLNFKLYLKYESYKTVKVTKFKKCNKKKLKHKPQQFQYMWKSIVSG